MTNTLRIPKVITRNNTAIPFDQLDELSIDVLDMLCIDQQDILDQIAAQLDQYHANGPSERFTAEWQARARHRKRCLARSIQRLNTVLSEKRKKARQLEHGHREAAIDKAFRRLVREEVGPDRYRELREQADVLASGQEG